MKILGIFPEYVGGEYIPTTDWQWAAVPQTNEFELPHAAAFRANPELLQSVTLQAALIMNGYVQDHVAFDRLVDEWQSSDVLVLHWFEPRQIAWSIAVCWWYRTVRRAGRIVLWGRHTRYGRDVSADLTIFGSDRFLPRIFDVIACRSDEAGLAASLRCLESNTNRAPGLLLSNGFEFTFTGRAIEPAGNDRLRETVGVGLPRPSYDQPNVCWQAANQMELESGLAAMHHWALRHPNGRWQCPCTYPWLNASGSRALKAQLSQFPQWNQSTWHDHRLCPPLRELPDLQ